MTPQARLLDRLRQQVHLAADQFRQTPLQGPEAEKPDMGSRIQLGRKIDIAARPGVTAGNGAEQRQVADAGAAQFRLVRPQGGVHVLGEIGRGGCAHRGFSELRGSTKAAGGDGGAGWARYAARACPSRSVGFPLARSVLPWPSVDRRGVEARATTTGSPDTSSAISNAMSVTAHTEV